MARQVKERTILTWIEDHPDLFYEFTNNSIYCTKCQTNIGCKKSSVKRHIEGPVHQGTFKKPDESFYFDLIRFLIICNIPWSQLNNPAFKLFFTKYLCCHCANRPTLPSETILRKMYLAKLFKQKIETIYNKISHDKLWISLDETTDFLGRHVVNFLVKPLNSLNIKKPYLIACKMLEKVNGRTISNFVIECLEHMWGESCDTNVGNVLVLCTDSVAYMLLAGRLLKRFLPNMKHVTCFAHALHRVSETIRSEYPDIDCLISNVKKVFLKAPSRVKILKDLYPDMPLPPEPVITRWGTWLHAVSYYVKYFNEIKTVLSRLRESEALSIRVAKQMCEKTNIENDLRYINEYFGSIELAILKLEKSDLSIVESFKILDEIRAIISWSSTESVKQKIENVMSRNPDVDVLRLYSERLSREVDSDDDILPYKFAPLTSVDVERSFSLYKWILSIKRNRLKQENIEKIMVIYFNSVDHALDEHDSEAEDD